jgi:hypothetical protein
MKHKKTETDAVRTANQGDTQSSKAPTTEQGNSKSAVPEERTTKAKANRKNALKSTGPKSADGKQKSRLNAQKDGLFSKEVVVTAAGERVKDFARFKAWVWDSVQPEDAIQEILTSDLVDNWWRRQRVRRCQSAELQNRLTNIKIHDYYLRSDEIEPMKIRFQLSLEQYQGTGTTLTSVDLNQIVVTELEEARIQLASTPLGLDFLIERVNEVKNEAESCGQILAASQVVLRACAGLTNEFASCCAVLNGINIRESAKAAERARGEQRGGTGQTKATKPEKAKGDQSGGEREAGERNEADRRFVLVSAIEMVAGELKLRKQLLEGIENSQATTRLAAAVLPADSSCDRFARAETVFDRRLYRALAALLATKQAKAASKILPG